jgi:hypothetical protein
MQLGKIGFLEKTENMGIWESMTDTTPFKEIILHVLPATSNERPQTMRKNTFLKIVAHPN